MKETENTPKTLPDNAYRELKPGETYEPLMSPNKQYKEVTFWSVCIGLIMTVLFSAAAAYLGLKVGQVFEAAYFHAIIAVGLSSALKRKMHWAKTSSSSLSEAVPRRCGRAIFTLPPCTYCKKNTPKSP